MTPRARLIDELSRTVLPWYGVDFKTVASGLRFQKIKRARDACSWYLWTFHRIPATKIGLIVQMDHTSVLVGIGRHCARIGLQSPQRETFERKKRRYVSRSSC